MKKAKNNSKGSEPLLAALYYPYMEFRSIETVKKLLLLYDKIYLIYPSQDWRRTGIAVGDTPGESVLKEHHYDFDEFVNDEFIKIIPANELAKKFTQEFCHQLDLDRKDKEINELAKKIKADWYIYDEKIPETILVDYGFDRYRVQDKQGHSLLKLPFLEGSSIMISHALCAALSYGQSLPLLTDDPIQQEYLRLRLRRGWNKLQSDLNFSRKLQQEWDVSNKVVTAHLADRAISLALPRVIADAALYSLQDIDKFRTHHKKELKALRNGLSKFAMQKIMWQATDIRDFERAVQDVVETEILPAFQDLEQNARIKWKDILFGITGGDIVKIAGISGVNSLVIRSLANLPGVAVGGLAFWGAAMASLGIVSAAKLWDIYREKKKTLADIEYLSYLVQVKATF